MSRVALLVEKMNIVKCKIREDWHYDRLKEIEKELSSIKAPKAGGVKKGALSDGLKEFIRINEDGTEDSFIYTQDFIDNGYVKCKINAKLRKHDECEIYGARWRNGRIYRVFYYKDGLEYSLSDLSKFGNAIYIRSLSRNKKFGWSRVGKWI